MDCRSFMKFAAVTLLVLTTLFANGYAKAATITLVNGDGSDEGFNDSALGQQRIDAFNYAAGKWEELLDSDVEILVEAKFDPLPCNAFSAVVGSAGTNMVIRDFAGAEYSNTWYPEALANKLAATDLTTSADISITLNSSIDYNNSCLNNVNWYYGTNGINGNDIDMADVVVHEIGHGLGFATFVDEQTGQRFLNRDDVYMKFLEDHSRGRRWSQMNNRQRKRSAVDEDDLHWVGENVVGASGGLNAGVHSSGHVEMYAPRPVEPGSSVSHWSTDVDPDESMEPFVAEFPIHNPGLAFELMLDLGWTALSLTPTVCGDGVREGAEECDTNDFGGNSCVSLGFASGTLTCDASCNFDISSCIPTVCGNNIIEGSEVCDGTSLGGNSCISQGYDGGDLACDSTCSGFDTSDCAGPTCGGNRESCGTGSDCCSGNCKNGTCRGN